MEVVPRPAVVCVVMREEDEHLLMVRRNESLRFMAGHHVFPGGRIDDDEGTRFVERAADAHHAKLIHAAAREVFEETGLLCVEGALPGDEDRIEARAAMMEGGATFDDVLERFRLSIPAQRFTPAGAWVTPKPSPIRFDTRYFLYRTDGSQREHLHEGEITALDWMRAAEARRRWRTGDIHVSTPVAFVLQQFANAPAHRAVEILQRGTERAPGEHNRFEIRHGITIIPLKSRTILPATHTNCIVVGEKDIYVIDPGSNDPDENTHLKRQIDNFQELGGTLRAIVLTHSHHDHTDGIPFVQEHYGLPLWAHEATAEQIPYKVDRFIREGDVIESAGDPPWRLRALHTPGHDPGHIAFFEETTGVLLAGDMVANPGTIIVSRQYRGDMTEFLDSLERLMEVPAKALIPSHGHPVGNPREELKKHRDHRLWREEKIRAAYEEGATTLPALLDAAYDDAPAASRPWAEHALRAHLHRLGFVLAE